MGIYQIAAIAVTGLLSAVLLTSELQAKPVRSSLVVTQLPRNAVPVNYKVTVTPDAANLSFQGQVAIEIQLLKASTSVTLNAADIAITQASIRSLKGSSSPLAVTLNPKEQLATLNFSRTLPAGNYVIDLTYSGRIYTQASGFFALDYKSPEGTTKRSLFTQFQAPDARRFVPSWDEPNYKATFDLTAIIPNDQVAVSNMPVIASTDAPNGKKAYRFAQSPKMSTYLLFLSVGDFERIAKKTKSTEVGIVMSKGSQSKGQYALDSSAKIVDYLESYFGTKYPLPKLDNIAGPGQSQFFGAMENWGAIFTFERNLLVDPKITTTARKQRMFTLAAHEIAHQWFGNLVTMQWWDDLWLNEGFATWIENKVTAEFNPEWQIEIDRVFSKEGAMRVDGFRTTNPVVQTIKTVEQAHQAFDVITYSKGAAIINMLEGYVGEDKWRQGVRTYMRKFAYRNTKTEDLWREIETAGGKGVKQVANDFTLQPGVPLIKFIGAQCDQNNTWIEVQQGEFSIDQKSLKDISPLKWNVPLTAQVLGHKSVSSIISTGKQRMKVPGCGPVLLNVGQTGYYRILYTSEQFSQLASAFARLSPIDQVGLLLESDSLAKADYQSIGVALNLLNAVPANATPRVLDTALDLFANHYKLMKAELPQQEKILALANSRFSRSLTQLGFVQNQSDSNLDANLRSSLIGVLGSMGNKEVNSEARRLFAALEQNPAALDGPLRSVWLTVVAEGADQPTWDKLRLMAQKAENEVVRTDFYRMLASAKNPALATQALKLALTSEPGATNSASIIGRVSREHPELAFEFTLANHSAVMALMDEGSRTEFVARIASNSEDPMMSKKLDAYAKQYLDPKSRKSIDQSIAAIEARIKSNGRIREGIVDWLKDQRS